MKTLLSLAFALLLLPFTARSGELPQEPKAPALNTPSQAEAQMPSARQLSQQGMMMQDMMQMMADIVKMQEKIVAGAGPGQKRHMLKSLSDMTARMNTMMLGMKGMLSPQQSPGLPSGSGSGGTVPPGIHAPKARERTEGEVTVKVALESSNGTLVFRVDCDSATVSVDQYKFSDMVRLRADGREFEPRVRSEEGSILHRSAIIEFTYPGARSYEIVFKGVGGAAETVFQFPF